MKGKASPESARTLFSYHSSHGTTEGETYAYLLRNETFDSKRGKALANQAIVAWWLAYARRANHEQARQTAIDCIEQLEQHIAKLRRDFQIPPATLPYQSITVLPVAAPSTAVSQPQASQPIAAPVVSETAMSETAPPETRSDDALYAQFDMEEALAAE